MVFWGLSALLLGTGLACRVEMGPPGGQAQTEGPVSGSVMIYTSMYRHVIDAIEPQLKAALPQVKVQWLQGGSEKLATRLDAELSQKAPRADLIMTSDPLWYERKKREGHLLPYASVRALAMPRELVDREGHFVTARISTMVLAYNNRKVSEADAPRSFAELFSERWRGKVTMPDPLGSGTTFTTLAFLAHHEGPDIIDRMKQAQTIASGGNSSTITRLESAEHLVGFVLLENVLKARTRGAPISYKLPQEGPVLVPGPIALLRGSPNPKAAKAVYDLLLSPKIQALIVKGDMHAPFEDLQAPAGAPKLDALLKTRYRWSPKFIESAVEKAGALRKRFAQVMGGA